MHTTPQLDTPDAAVERFLQACAQALRGQRCERLLLSGYRGEEPGLQRLHVRAVELRGQPCLSFVFSHATRDVTKNLSLEQGLAALRQWIGTHAFGNAHLHSEGHELQLAISRKGRYSLRRGSSAIAAAPAAHNREKRRKLAIDRPFLVELGVTDAQHRLIPAMARKWKQINRFLEVIDDALAASALDSDSPIEVLDFGSGKGYLSFALHDHLGATGRPVRVTGVELRSDLVQLCNAAATRLQLRGLRFEHGDVGSCAPRPVDLMIALHACDTATDHAIHFGVRSGAAVICCAPCCHKQLRPQLLTPQPLRALLQHGIHAGQEAEMLTDALRALLLEACGYDTKVFEFISLEHTAKNKMIMAVKRPGHAAAVSAVLDQARDLKAFYGIRDQCLETLLRADALI